MLKSKRLNLCSNLPGPFMLFLLFSGVNKECTAQKVSVPARYNSSCSVATYKNAVDSLDAGTLNSKGVIDTSEIVQQPRIKLNPKGEKYISNYLKKNREELLVIQKRSARYFKSIESILKKSNVPVELKYLAVIESQLKTSAVSHVGAAGMWQFMPTTARSLGLKVSAKKDERKQFTKSTKAAAIYIKALYAQFGDWLLVVAAYNSGAGPVYKAIKKSGSCDFWLLQHYLPAETRAHVKRYIGAHYFFENKGSTATLTKAETKYDCY